MNARKATGKGPSNSDTEGRPPVHEQKKQNHNISVTPDGWKGVRTVARKHGCSSVSELIEKLGRMQLIIEDKSSLSIDDLVKAIDAKLHQ